VVLSRENEKWLGLCARTSPPPIRTTTRRKVGHRKQFTERNGNSSSLAR